VFYQKRANLAGLRSVRLRNHKNNLTRDSPNCRWHSQSALAERIQTRGFPNSARPRIHSNQFADDSSATLMKRQLTLRLLGGQCWWLKDAHQEWMPTLNILKQFAEQWSRFTPDIANLLTTLFGGYGARWPDRLSFFHRNGKDTVCLVNRCGN